MIAALVPPAVAVAVAATLTPPPALLPEERPIVARARADRRREFAAGRGCARRALARLGVHGHPVLAGRRREPLWPTGVVGSITHSGTFVAAAAAAADRIALLGIDAEQQDAVAGDLEPIVCSPAERAACATLGPWWRTLLFSAKESVFKATYPRWRVELVFTDVEVAVDAAVGEFMARPVTARAAPLAADLAALQGRFALAGGLVLTAAWKKSGTVPPTPSV